MKGRYSRALLFALAMVLLVPPLILLSRQLRRPALLERIPLRDAQGQPLSAFRAEAVNDHNLALCSGNKVWLASASGQVSRKLTDSTEVVPELVPGPAGTFAVIDIPMNRSFRGQGSTLGDIPGWIRFYDAAGKLSGERSLAMPTYSRQHCISGERLIIASGSEVVCCDFSGQVLWSHPLVRGIQITPEAGPQGRVVCADSRDETVCLGADGTVLWQINSPNLREPHQLGELCCFSVAGKLRALDADGRKAFEVAGTLNEPWRLLITAGDRLICERGAELHSVDSAGRTRRLARLGPGYLRDWRVDSAGRLWVLYRHQAQPVTTLLSRWLPLGRSSGAGKEYTELLVFDPSLRLARRIRLASGNDAPSSLAALPDGRIAVLGDSELLLYRP